MQSGAPDIWLQWGHDFSAVEIVVVLEEIVGYDFCFNGATTFQPWKFKRKLLSSPMVTPLQWGHDFSAVEMLSTASVFMADIPASMGPRLFSRGNHITVVLGTGGASVLQWGHDFSAVEILEICAASLPQIQSFNGATTFQPWKLGGALPVVAPRAMASMGPRLFSRGNAAHCAKEARAIIWLQWGHDFSAVEIMGLDSPKAITDRASMGPRLFSRGNASRWPQGQMISRSLQWGHDFSAVEMARKRDGLTPSDSASMGPRLFSRGNSALSLLLRSQYPCFNGATTFQPWKCCLWDGQTLEKHQLQWGHDFSAVEMTDSEWSETRLVALQWGHDFSAVEIAYDAAKSAAPAGALQWGHDFSAVEMLQINSKQVSRLQRFNGATTFQPWK